MACDLADAAQADTQMISLLYRTHKALPPSSKVSSLYVFDSIARAAHRTKTKKGLVADLNNPIGNAASFLVRLEGMLDGLVDDMLVHGPPEGKASVRSSGRVLPVLSLYCHPSNAPTDNTIPSQTCLVSYVATCLLSSQEKTRKVVDIWTREGTFPPGALTRLADKVKTGACFSLVFAKLCNLFCVTRPSARISH